MSYLTISQCVADGDMAQRITACWSQEGNDAATVPPALYWSVAGAADVEAAYAAALAAGTERPGADEAAVTDQMILSRVQAFTPPG